MLAEAEHALAFLEGKHKCGQCSCMLADPDPGRREEVYLIIVSFILLNNLHLSVILGKF